MLNQAFNTKRWNNHLKPGLVLPARAIAKSTVGYTVEVEGPQRVKGLLVTNEFIKLGANVLVKLTGYSNGLATLAPIWAAQA
jgi:hypothetical protein